MKRPTYLAAGVAAGRTGNRNAPKPGLRGLYSSRRLAEDRDGRSLERRLSMQRFRHISLAALVLGALLVTPRATQAQPRTASAPVSQLTSGAQVKSYLTKVHFHGYILLVRHGRVILNKGYGLADTKQKHPNTIHTRWPVFGIEDFMVAMAILTLQEQKKLAIGHSVCRYLAGCPKAWRAITIRDLLLGTSQIPNYNEPYFVAGSMQRTLAGCKSLPLAGVPGTIPQDEAPYLCDLLLLSLIIEKVTGRSFATAMKRMVFDPAGLRETHVTSSVPPNVAHGYQRGVPSPSLHVGGYPLIYASVADVQRLDRAFLAGRILSKEVRRQISTPYLAGYLGYGTGVVKADRFPSGGSGVYPFKTNTVVAQSTGGPDPNSFAINNEFSPDDGTLDIEMTNDTGFFDDNNLQARLTRLLWAR
jgi:CubicO group peptidase (beta-lactamase class C family)